MKDFEKLMESIEDSDLDEASKEAALDSMGFVLSLHNMFRENGVHLQDEPDVSTLENAIDGLYGELCAACVFLSEKCFERVPAMLRVISNSFDEADKIITDPSGVTGTSVPTVIRKGYSRLADRIEATKKTQMELLAKALHDSK